MDYIWILAIQNVISIKINSVLFLFTSRNAYYLIFFCWSFNVFFIYKINLLVIICYLSIVLSNVISS